MNYNNHTSGTANSDEYIECLKFIDRRYLYEMLRHPALTDRKAPGKEDFRYSGSRLQLSLLESLLLQRCTQTVLEVCIQKQSAMFTLID